MMVCLISNAIYHRLNWGFHTHRPVRNIKKIARGQKYAEEIFNKRASKQARLRFYLRKQTHIHTHIHTLISIILEYLTGNVEKEKRKQPHTHINADDYTII